MSAAGGADLSLLCVWLPRGRECETVAQVVIPVTSLVA